MGIQTKVLHMGHGNLKHKYKLDDEWIGGSPAEKGLGLSVEEELNVSQQCLLAA